MTVLLPSRQANFSPTHSRRQFRKQLYMIVMMAGAFCLAGSAHASPITYTLSGTFSGSLGSTSFTDTAGTFIFVGDTTSVIDSGGNFPINADGNGSFSLSGNGPATFLSSTFGTESEYGAASFMDAAAGFAVGEYNENTPSDVLSVFGPAISGMFVSYGTMPESTSLGDLIITGAAGDVTFQATMPITASVAPEPQSLFLTGTGALSAAGLFRRRRNKA